MKQANNSEMDLLLRSLARRQADRTLLGDGSLEDHTDSPHLDADELSSYAERTLPAATRARYTMHLADCPQCRKIVAELAPVVAASAREHAGERETTTAWQTIRHFFSWPVLRYAVPALSLLAFLVVALVVYRDSRLGFVAMAPEPTLRQDQRAQTAPPATVAEKSETLADSAPAVQADPQAKANQETSTGAQKSDVTTPAEAPAASLSKDAEGAKPTPTVPPTYAPEPAGAPAPKPQDQVAEVRREATTDAAARPQSPPPQTQRVARDNYETATDQVKEEERARGKREDKDAQVASVGSQNTADQNRTSKLRTLQAGRGEAAGNKADDETAETRSVAGRRFRRQGGMWVDTAYQSGMSLTHIVRGSEQYRALIADEPSIRSVAEQLQGEVIVIWKGRGYRIR